MTKYRNMYTYCVMLKKSIVFLHSECKVAVIICDLGKTYVNYDGKLP